MRRCKWVNLRNAAYVAYHDNEWGKPIYDDKKLFEMLLLESFQAGLSWEIVLNKREAFAKAFNDFDYQKISRYDEAKVAQLMQNPQIIRNRLKIAATITNAQKFISIQTEYGSFADYIWSFTNHQIIINQDDVLPTHSPLSDKIAKELKKKGFKFVGTTIVYSYLQAIGMVNDHETTCEFR